MALHLDGYPGDYVTIGADITVTVDEKGCNGSGRSRLVIEMPEAQKLMVRFGDDVRMTVREKSGRRMSMSFIAPRTVEVERHRAETTTEPLAQECRNSHKGGTHGTHNRGSERP